MYSIWLCEVYDNTDKFNDKYSLSYEKLLYENVKYEEFKDYITSLCKEYHWEIGKYFGSDNQCIELTNVDNNGKEYCLFFEEELEGEKNERKNI